VSVDPSARATHDFTDPPDLVHLVSTREEWLQCCDFDGHGTDSPDVHWCRVLAGSQQNLGSSVPSSRDVGRVRDSGFSLPGEAEVCNLNGKVGGRRWGSDKRRVSLEAVASLGGRRGNQNVLGLDVAVEEVVVVNVFQARENLTKDALDTRAVERLVVARLHQLVQVAIHVLHGDVELLAQWVEEDVVRGHEMGVVRERLQENDFTQLQALREMLKGLLHRLDGNL
jgi:hypothetical protein